MVQVKYLSNSELLSPRPASNLGLKSGSPLENLGAQQGKAKEIANQKAVQERTNAETRPNNNTNAPATK